MIKPLFCCPNNWMDGSFARATRHCICTRTPFGWEVRLRADFEDKFAGLGPSRRYALLRDLAYLQTDSALYDDVFDRVGSVIARDLQALAEAGPDPVDRYLHSALLDGNHRRDVLALALSSLDDDADIQTVVALLDAAEPACRSHLLSEYAARRLRHEHMPPRSRRRHYPVRRRPRPKPVPWADLRPVMIRTALAAGSDGAATGAGVALLDFDEMLRSRTATPFRTLIKAASTALTRRARLSSDEGRRHLTALLVHAAMRSRIELDQRNAEGLRPCTVLARLLADPNLTQLDRAADILAVATPLLLVNEPYMWDDERKWRPIFALLEAMAACDPIRWRQWLLVRHLILFAPCSFFERLYKHWFEDSAPEANTRRWFAQLIRDVVQYNPGFAAYFVTCRLPSDAGLFELVLVEMFADSGLHVLGTDLYAQTREWYRYATAGNSAGRRRERLFLQKVLLGFPFRTESAIALDLVELALSGFYGSVLSGEFQRLDHYMGLIDPCDYLRSPGRALALLRLYLRFLHGLSESEKLERFASWKSLTKFPWEAVLADSELMALLRSMPLFVFRCLAEKSARPASAPQTPNMVAQAAVLFSMLRAKWLISADTPLIETVASLLGIFPTPDFALDLRSHQGQSFRRRVRTLHSLIQICQFAATQSATRFLSAKSAFRLLSEFIRRLDRDQIREVFSQRAIPAALLRIPLRTANPEHLDLIRFVVRKGGASLRGSPGGLHLLRFLLESLPDAVTSARIRLMSTAACLVDVPFGRRCAAPFQVWLWPEQLAAVVHDLLGTVPEAAFRDEFGTDRLRFMLTTSLLNVTLRADRDLIEELIESVTDSAEIVPCLRDVSIQSGLDRDAWGPRFRRLVFPDPDPAEPVGTSP